jgi:hypothetical protein
MLRQSGQMGLFGCQQDGGNGPTGHAGTIGGPNPHHPVIPAAGCQLQRQACQIRVLGGKQPFHQLKRKIDIGSWCSKTGISSKEGRIGHVSPLEQRLLSATSIQWDGNALRYPVDCR